MLRLELSKLLLSGLNSRFLLLAGSCLRRKLGFLGLKFLVKLTDLLIAVKHRASQQLLLSEDGCLLGVCLLKLGSLSLELLLHLLLDNACVALDVFSIRTEALSTLFMTVDFLFEDAGLVHLLIALLLDLGQV